MKLVCIALLSAIFVLGCGKKVISADPSEASRKVASLLSVAAIEDNPQHVHRVYDPFSNDELYLSSRAKVDALVAQGWSDRGTAFGLFSEGGPGRAQIFVLSNPNNQGIHTYTSDMGERNGLIAAGWTDEGALVGYLSTVALAGTLEVFRIYDTQTGAHILTTSVAELRTLELDDVSPENHSKRYLGEGSLGFAIPLQSVENAFLVAVAYPNDRRRLFRITNASQPDALLTSNEAEVTSLLTNSSSGWKFRGETFSISEAPKPGYLPLYRLCPPAGAHYFTAQQSERDYLVALGWRDEGVLGYISQARQRGMVEVFHVYDSQTSLHHFVTSEQELQRLLSNAQHVQHRSLGYATPEIQTPSPFTYPPAAVNSIARYRGRDKVAIYQFERANTFPAGFIQQGQAFTTWQNPSALRFDLKAYVHPEKNGDYLSISGPPSNDPRWTIRRSLGFVSSVPQEGTYEIFALYDVLYDSMYYTISVVERDQLLKGFLRQPYVRRRFEIRPSVGYAPLE